MPPMKIAAIYIRQSVAHAGELGNSPAQQESACRRLPAVRECDSVEVYRDINESGGNPGRADFLRWMARMEEGAVSVAAIYEATRMARDGLIGGDFIRALRAHPEVSPSAVKGTVDVHSAQGRAAFRSQMVHSQEYREMISEKLKDTHANLHEHGINTGPAPYGYKYEGTATFNDKDSGETRLGRAMVPDPETAPVLRRIFNTYAEGASSARQIARALDAEKIPAPVSNRNKRNPKGPPDILT